MAKKTIRCGQCGHKAERDLWDEQEDISSAIWGYCPKCGEEQQLPCR